MKIDRVYYNGVIRTMVSEVIQWRRWPFITEPL
mgnify:CR=1 FL=1